MAEESDPPRKFYVPKERSFERLNKPANAAPGPNPPVRSATSVTGDQRIDVRELALIATAAVPDSKTPRPPTPENEVHDILRENLAHANAAGLNDATPRPRRRSLRKRDYLFLFVSGNLVLGVGTYIMPLIGFAGVILYNIMLAWVMWFIMDDY